MLCFRNGCAIAMGRGIPPTTPQIASDQSALLFGLHMYKINDFEILPCVSAPRNDTGSKNIVGVYQGPSFNVPPDSSADNRVWFIILASPQWLEMQTVVYRTQGILPLPPKVETQLVSSSEAGLTGLRSDSSAQHEQQGQISTSPSRLVPHFCLVPCQERGLPLFFLLMCSFIHSPANHSDLLITFGELEQAASRLSHQSHCSH